jgi:hypothetical protein
LKHPIHLKPQELIYERKDNDHVYRDSFWGWVGLAMGIEGKALGINMNMRDISSIESLLE